MDAPKDNLTRSVPFELRAGVDDGDGLTLRGYGSVFNEWTVIDSWEGRFMERIAPGAFKRTLKNNGSRVRLQFDHGQHPVIGSIPIGRIMSLSEDRRGLYVEARLSDNWLVEPVRQAIAEGSIDGMSFRFSVVEDSWAKLDSDMPERTISEVRLMEVGPVVWPAYEGTSVGVRASELAQNLLATDVETRREVARLLTSSTMQSVGTPPEPAAGTSERLVTEPVEEREGLAPEGTPTEPDPVTIRRASRPRIKSDRLRETLSAVRSVIAESEGAA